jgi:hypothetical protein
MTLLPSEAILHTVEWQDGWWIEKGLEEHGSGLLVDLLRHLPGNTEEEHIKHQLGDPVARLRFESDTLRTLV